MVVVFVVGLLWGITLTVVIIPSAPPTYVTVTTPVRTVCFSPNGGCAEQVVYWIGRANLTIHILIYSFTLDSIGDALISAFERGITIQIVFEASQISNYSQYDRLKEAGIQVRKDTNPAAMHDKIMVVDGNVVAIGSFNFSTNAETENNENLIVIVSPTIAQAFEAEFQKIWDESTS